MARQTSAPINRIILFCKDEPCLGGCNRADPWAFVFGRVVIEPTGETKPKLLSPMQKLQFPNRTASMGNVSRMIARSHEHHCLVRDSFRSFLEEIALSRSIGSIEGRAGARLHV